MNKLLNTNETAKRLGTSKSYICRLCKTNQLPGAIKKNGCWQIPSTADVRMSEAVAADAAIPDELWGVPPVKQQEAIRRSGLLKELSKHVARIVIDGGLRTYAYESFAIARSIPVSSLLRWRKAYRLHGLVGLVDSRGGCANPSDQISPTAFDFFRSLYLDPRQMSVKLCWQMIRELDSSESRGWHIPPLHSMHRLVNQIPLGARVLHREGLTKYEALCAPYILKDIETIKPGEIWVGDHHQCNCWVRYRNRWVRPWLTAWQDMRSRAMLGWYVSACPNQTTIMRSMKRAVEVYGPPDAVKIDNGKDYDSQMFTGTTKAARHALTRKKVLKAGYIDEPIVAGIYAMLDISVSFAIPYNAKAKPIERFFDTFDRQFIKAIETYCGKDIPRRPADIQKMLEDEAVIARAETIESFADKARTYFTDTYNRSAHTGDGMDGRSPDDVMNTRESRRAVAEGVLELLMRVWSGELVVGKNGVKFKGIWYGQYDQELLIRQGHKVRVAYDPDDVSKIWVYDAKTMKLITRAWQARLVAYGHTVDVNEDDVREGMRMARRAKKIVEEYSDASLIAQSDITTLAMKAMQADVLPPAEPARSVAIRPVRTPLDGQVAEHRRRKNQEILQQAIGTQDRKKLDFDLESINPHRQSRHREPLDFGVDTTNAYGNLENEGFSDE
jgi:putative transposase